MEKVNIANKFDQFNEYWNPKIAGEVNDSYIKLVKVKGEFIWHHHDNEDELFLVIKGKLTIRLRTRDIHLEEGEFVIIPKGIEHMPVALEEAHLVVFELKTVLNTGNVICEKTVLELKQI